MNICCCVMHGMDCADVSVCLHVTFCMIRQCVLSVSNASLTIGFSALAELVGRL